MFSTIATWLLSLFSALDYWSIFILMSVESSLIPFPSEIIMPPAGYLASQGQLNIFLVIIAGTLGSLTGALFNYFLADFLGRPLLYALAESRWGKLLLLSPKNLQKSENYFNRYGRVTTFIGRLLPAIRQLISLPAGLARMPLLSFVGFTALGSVIWMTTLTVAGYMLGANQAMIKYYYHYFQTAVWLGLGAVALLLAGWLWFKYTKRRKTL